MFSNGETALLVNYPQWHGPRSYRVVKIGKVHKTGRLTLEVSRDQWRHQKGWNGEQDYFIPTASSSANDRLQKDSPELRAEIDREQEAQKKIRALFEIGAALQRVRNLEDGARIYDSLPDAVKSLAKQSQR